MTAVRTISEALESADFVSAVRRVVDVVAEHRLPPPASLWSSADQTTAYVASRDLPAWLIAFDLPAPEWKLVRTGEQAHYVAEWAEADLDRIGFNLFVVRVDDLADVEQRLAGIGREVVASDHASEELQQAARMHGFVADGRPDRVTLEVDGAAFAHFCDATGGVTR